MSDRLIHTTNANAGECASDWCSMCECAMNMWLYIKYKCIKIFIAPHTTKAICRIFVHLYTLFTVSRCVTTDASLDCFALSVCCAVVSCFGCYLSNLVAVSFSFFFLIWMFQDNYCVFSWGFFFSLLLNCEWRTADWKYEAIERIISHQSELFRDITESFANGREK